jgi:hypothetical protein
METKVLQASVAIAALVWIAAGNLSAGQGKTVVLLTASQPLLMVQQSDPSHTPHSDRLETQDEEDPMVGRWKNNEVRQMSELNSDQVIIERVLVIGASLAGLFILFRLAFPN